MMTFDDIDVYKIVVEPDNVKIVETTSKEVMAEVSRDQFMEIAKSIDCHANLDDYEYYYEGDNIMVMEPGAAKGDPWRIIMKDDWAFIEQKIEEMKYKKCLGEL